MSRIQNKGRACIVAASAILLCLVSLTGATLALFTGDADDSTIGIVAMAGGIKVDLVDLNGDSLQENALRFQTTSENREILMEPGSAFRTQGFRIVNNGSVPIQFRLAVSKEIIETTDNQRIVVDMARFLESFDVWITQDLDNPMSGTDLREFTGYLEKGTSNEKPYYLLIKMKETVGNDFQGRSYSGIGVTVYAVQGNGELTTEGPAPTDTEAPINIEDPIDTTAPIEETDATEAPEEATNEE